MRFKEERYVSPDERWLRNVLGWIGCGILVAIGFTFPVWGILVGLL